MQNKEFRSRLKILVVISFNGFVIYLDGFRILSKLYTSLKVGTLA